jgi:hypothetical protein
MSLHTGGDDERAGYLVRAQPRPQDPHQAAEAGRAYMRGEAQAAAYLVRVAKGRDQVGELAQRLADLAPAERVGYLARLERCIRAHQAGG